jgi:hypothetical protein
MDSQRNDTSNCFTLENKNTEHAAGTINSDSFRGRISIADDDRDSTLSFSIGLEDGGLVFSFIHSN